MEYEIRGDPSYIGRTFESSIPIHKDEVIYIAGDEEDPVVVVRVLSVEHRVYGFDAKVKRIILNCTTRPA